MIGDWNSSSFFFFFHSNIKVILKEENSTIIIPSMFSSCVVILSFTNNDGSVRRIKSFVHSEGIVFRTNLNEGSVLNKDILGNMSPRIHLVRVVVVAAN